MLMGKGTIPNNLKWQLEDSVLMISGQGEMEQQGFGPWYGWRNEIQSIEIEPGVRSIGSGAFKSCSFTKISIPESVEKIGEFAFAGCLNLRNIDLPEGLLHIGRLAFWNCKELESIRLPKSLQTIDSTAFVGCRSLREVFYAGEKGMFTERFPNIFPSQTAVHFGENSAD